MQDSDIAFDVFVSSLRSLDDPNPLTAIFTYLDSCLSHLAKRTVEYHEEMQNIVTSVSPSSSIDALASDLILIVLVDQMGFLIRKADTSATRDVVKWLAHYLELHWIRVRQVEASNTDVHVMGQVFRCLRNRMGAVTNDQESIDYLWNTLKEPPALDMALSLTSTLRSSRSEPASEAEPDVHMTNHDSKLEVEATRHLQDVLAEPQLEDEDHRGLRRWLQEDMAVAISEGAIGELILCLCSQHAEIRQQALVNLKKCREILYNLQVR